LLGVLRIGRDQVTVYGVHASGAVQPLFDTREFTQLSAIAKVGSDVLLLGNVWDGHDEAPPNPELARFGRDGRPVWRQAALRQGDPAALSADQIGQNVRADMPMIVDADGRASLAVVELSSFGADLLAFAVVQVGPDGNVRWAANPDLGSHLATPFGLVPTPLALDSRERLVTADNEYMVYTVARLDLQGEPPTRARAVQAQRSREEFWEPALMGLACDAADRVLVATTSGERTAQRLLIDRYSEDFAERETFVLPGGREAPPPGAYFTIDGILAAPDESVMVWSTSSIARMALP
jgi:hypothetical protein